MIKLRSRSIERCCWKNGFRKAVLIRGSAARHRNTVFDARIQLAAYSTPNTTLGAVHATRRNIADHNRTKHPVPLSKVTSPLHARTHAPSRAQTHTLGGRTIIDDGGVNPLSKRRASEAGRRDVASRSGGLLSSGGDSIQPTWVVRLRGRRRERSGEC